jgi:hypothetical protein
VLIGLLLLGVLLMVDPGWSSSDRALSLRIRDGDELVKMMRRQARALGERMVEAAEDEELPNVSAGPRRMRRQQVDGITDAERRRLDRLIEEKTRDY